MHPVGVQCNIDIISSTGKNTKPIKISQDDGIESLYIFDDIKTSEKSHAEYVL